MRAVVQRVAHASVTVDDVIVGAIQHGMMILLGVGPNDGPAESAWMAKKLAGLRIFNDANGKMNLSLADCGGSALVVSQFTLYGNCRKGRRPSFVDAAHPDLAEPLYERFCDDLAGQGVAQVARGVFGADMKVDLRNDGPVTLIVDTP